jgi:hypothetical protein
MSQCTETGTLSSYVVTRSFSGTCPHCAQIDQVQRVAAIVGSGRSTYREGGMTVRGPGGVSVGIQSNDGVAITDTARSLDFVPPSRPHINNLAGCVSTAMLALGMYGIVLSIADSNDHNAALVWLLVFLVGLVPYVHAVRIRYRPGAKPDIPAAWTVWSSGWFCHRCGGAFFPVDSPHTVPTGQLLSPEEFQRVVHDAGAGVRG